jgi:hypothetical protein
VVPHGSEPGVTKNSRWIASHLDTGFTPGDLIAYEHESGRTWIARVVTVESKGLLLKRGGSPEEFLVPWDKIIGKMLFSYLSPGAVKAAAIPASMPAPVSEGTSKAPDQKPILRGVRLQRNGKEWATAVYSASGQMIHSSTEGEDVYHLMEASSYSGVIGQNSDDCWLQLWFEHPDFDRHSNLAVEILEVNGKPLENRSSSFCGSSWSSNKPNPPLQSLVVSPGRQGSLPAAVCVVLRYSIGFWSYQSPVSIDFHGARALGEGCYLAAFGDNREHRAFVSWSQSKEDMLYDAVAQLKAGGRLGSLGRLATGASGNLIRSVHFEVPLNDLRSFVFRSRKIQTIVFEEVVLPPLPAESNK